MTAFQIINSDFILINNSLLHLKREDLIHPFVSGNKYRKLKYNLIETQNKGFDTLLTFGGAYSNHIAATAAAGSKYGLKTIGVIRGEEFQDQLDENPTLAFAKAKGMELYFISRENYRLKDTAIFLSKLKEKFGNFYHLPEGGTNALAVKGCEEILIEDDKTFDLICAPVGTGGTIAGIINSSFSHQKVIGFSALKGNFLENEIKKWTNKTNWVLTDEYSFGGYAKINQVLIEFINQFRKETGIPLDPVYTGKMIYGIMAMIDSGKIPKNSRILAVHTGGLQGIEGMNQKLKSKNLPLIEI